MRPQYSYNPPRSSNWLENLRPLITPPRAYVTFLVGIGLALYLLTYQDFRVARYGAHLLILLIAFPVHELAHAVVADRLGDPTPRQHGRITLNPFAQLNLVGSLLMLFIGLGWAYVPVTPRNLRPNPRTGHMIVAAAGPISNLVLAIICALLWLSLGTSLVAAGAIGMAEYVRRVLFFFTFINLALLFFNLVPIAPLDGFTVLKGLLPYDLAYKLEGLQRYGMLLFLGVFFIAPLLGLPVVDRLIFGPALAVTNFLFSLT
jgi:Zn-dependent protease